MEHWIEIDNYPNYLVSDYGRVKGLRTNTILKVRLDIYGYPIVAIRNRDGPKTTTTHRLVVSAFYGLPPKGFDINHIDGDKTNNHLANLEVITHSENLQHAYDTGLHSHQRRVRCLETDEVFNSISAASRKTGMSIAYISMEARGLRKSRRGPHFDLVDERR